MSESGFTLIELLVVVAIIGILAASALPQILSARCQAVAGAAKSEIGTVRTAFTQCLIDQSPQACSGVGGNLANYLPAQVSNNAGNWSMTVSGGTLMNISKNISCNDDNLGSVVNFNVQAGNFS